MRFRTIGLEYDFDVMSERLHRSVGGEGTYKVLNGSLLLFLLDCEAAFSNQGMAANTI